MYVSFKLNQTGTWGAQSNTTSGYEPYARSGNDQEDLIQILMRTKTLTQVHSKTAKDCITMWPPHENMC